METLLNIEGFHLISKLFHGFSLKFNPMNKLLLILSLLAMLSCKKENDNQKYEWKDVSPESTTDFQDIQMLNEKVGYVAGFLNTGSYNVVCTQIQPGGNTYISLDNTLPYLSCNLADTLSSTSLMYKTIDGGKSWNPITLPFSKYKHMSFVDEYLGFVLSGDGLYKTADGGQNWQKIMENSVVYDYTAESSVFQKIKFTSPNNGFLYTNNFKGGCVFVSVNGNGELKRIISNRLEIPAQIPFINEIEYRSGHPEEVFILTLSNLYMSNENGDDLQLLQDIYPFEKITYFGETWYAHFSEILSRSDNRGKTWNNISMLPINHCSILATVGENRIGVSDKFGIYLTDDSGLSFRKMSKPDVEITDICFPTSQTGLAIGPNGKILRYFQD